MKKGIVNYFKQAQKGSDIRGHNYKADATNVLPSPFATSTAWLEGRSKRASGKQRSAEMTSTDMPATTLNYRAPELDVFEPNWGSVVDCWSIGCILAEMYSGKADMHAGTAKGRVFGSTVDVSAAARSPSFTEIGRGPLFRAETAFEHLAMVERLLGKLPRRIYTVGIARRKIIRRSGFLFFACFNTCIYVFYSRFQSYNILPYSAGNM